MSGGSLGLVGWSRFTVPPVLLQARRAFALSRSGQGSRDWSNSCAVRSRGPGLASGSVPAVQLLALSSFLLSNGEVLNSLLRGLVVGLGCRSVLLDDRGMAISLDSDPHSSEYEGHVQ